ncbi:hypothetical protein KHC28_04950 [Ancylobacter sonchi]|uniref:hypothetical protein n=1 Tax=Ancylobacter TaxID=99 RepID=UPI001BD633EC|nr:MULTISPECIES: hypothetical protein [Ancylobacter]MBS7533003.1 hypothetical protein [Ancylobacter sonchi]MCB4770907.1 hypothetical protein [Ancylobacter sp. Lp-2]
MTIQSPEDMKTALYRARVHLSLLETDATHPLDLSVVGARSTPMLILRSHEELRSAHSDATLSYELMRDLMMAALQARIDELTERLGLGAGDVPLDKLQYGDQTEA